MVKIQETKKTPLVVIVGQTASGKTSLSIELAKLFDGEIISADSRQVYREFDLCSGKVTREEMQGIPHYMLDVLSVSDGVYTAHDFAKDARLALNEIVKKGKLPIIVGGTGFYIDVMLGRVELDDVAVDKVLRQELESKTEKELFDILQVLDVRRAERVDKQNKIRLIRAIEIVKGSAEGEEEGGRQSGAGSARAGLPPLPDGLKPIWIGIKWDKETLRRRIKLRLKERFEKGMCHEVQKAHNSGVGWERFEELGLEMRYCKRLLCGELDEPEFLRVLENKIWQYAKRQATYWRRNKDINWFDAKDSKKILEFLKQKLY